MKVLILGTNGMLGHALFCSFSKNSNLRTYGTLRNENHKDLFHESYHKNLIFNVDILDLSNLEKVLMYVRPNIIFNCVGLTKHNANSSKIINFIEINSLFPHKLKELSDSISSKLISISTDCVFSGKKGLYSEFDSSDPIDLYGQTKFLGEPSGKNALTIRTSIIGHELNTSQGLLEWFLSQNKSCKGFTSAIFSGFPTAYLAKIFLELIIFNEFSGLYHIASKPISKYELLLLIKEIYGLDICVIPSDDVVINRSLNGALFEKVSGFISPEWPELIEFMYQDYKESNHYNV